MKNTVIVLFLSICIQASYFSQKRVTGLEGKRFNFEAGIGASLFPSYIFFNDDFYNKNKITDLVSVRYNFELGYTITNKIKASLYYSRTTVNIDSVDNYDDRYNQSRYNYLVYNGHNSFRDSKVNSYGVKFNYYLHGFIAPVGGSIGLSFKKTFIHTANHVWTDAIEGVDGWGDPTVIVVRDSAELKMNYTTIGFHYENMTFLSSKIPLYFKYGISLALRVGKNATRGGKELDLTTQEDSYGDEITNIYSKFLGRNYKHDIFEFNFGLGYIF